MSDLAKFNAVIKDDRTRKHLENVLGEKRLSFVSNITSLVSNNLALQECEPLTILYAGIRATVLDLPLDSNLGFAYVIPFKNTKKGITEAQFQIGFKGFKQLAIRTGQFRTIHATDVRDGEIAENNRLTGEIKFDFIKDDKERLKKKVIGYVSYFELLNGFKSTFYMSAAEVENHGKRYSQTYKRGFGMWKDDFDNMALKTVTKLNLSKNAPLSVEIQTATKSDQAVITEEGEHYIDNDVSLSIAENVDNPLEAEVIQGDKETKKDLFDGKEKS